MQRLTELTARPKAPIYVGAFLVRERGNAMRKLFKSTVINKATLLGESVTNRYALAKCTARLEWHKVMDDVPALGNKRITKCYHVALVVTYEHHDVKDLPLERLQSFRIVGEVKDRHDIIQDVNIGYLKLIDDELNLIEDGTCMFELCCTQDEIKELMNLYN